MKMKETRYTADRAGPLLPFLLERAKGGRNHVKGLLARGQVTVDGEIVTRHDHPLAPGQVVAVAAQAPERPPFPVLHVDGRILVSAKPPALLPRGSAPRLGPQRPSRKGDKKKDASIAGSALLLWETGN